MKEILTKMATEDKFDQLVNSKILEPIKDETIVSFFKSFLQDLEVKG